MEKVESAAAAAAAAAKSVVSLKMQNFFLNENGDNLRENFGIETSVPVEKKIGPE